MSDKEHCNTCNLELDSDGCFYQSLKDKRFLATLDKDNNVIQECCNQCAQDLIDENIES